MQHLTEIGQAYTNELIWVAHYPEINPSEKTCVLARKQNS